MLVLLARPARDRQPAATHWRLIEYDAVTGLPVADVASQWEPAGSAPTGTITAWVRGWAADVLGHPVRIEDPATSLAGPGSWHVHPRDCGYDDRRDSH